MRKRYKKKLRSCKVCKPHKMNIVLRWKEKESFKLKMYEQEKRKYV